MLFIKKLRWDDWNITRIARHNVVPDEVEQVILGNVLVQEGKKGRMALVGLTNLGRMLRVILDPEGEGSYYPVTAHVASKKDKALYKHEKEDKKK